MKAKKENIIHEMNILGHIIKAGRLNQRLSQTELAKMAETTQLSVNRCENGQYGASVKMYYKLISTLDMKIEIKVKSATKAIFNYKTY